MSEKFPSRESRPYSTHEKLLGGMALLAALSAFPFQETSAQQQEEIRNPVFAKMVGEGEIIGDCEEYFSNELALLPIQEQKEEIAFAAVYSEKGTCQIMPVGFGEEGGVFTNPELLKKIKDKQDSVKVVLYHTHPSTFSIEEENPENKEMGQEIRSGILPPFRISPPSSDDYMTMAAEELKKQEAGSGMGVTEERIITPLGIWRYGIQGTENMNEKKDESMKLGSLFDQTDFARQNWGDTKKMLEGIKKGYADVASTAYNLSNLDNKWFSEKALADYRNGDKKELGIEINEKVLVASEFAHAMNTIGYKVEFRLHQKYANF